MAKAPPKARTLREIKLETPIRYSAGDGIEKWLNGLLCLDATILPKANVQGCPLPAACELFYVSRDTLFSYHPASEVFLQRMMALYVASHYKNQPNDLQLLSDAPAHHLFVLLPPIKDDESHLPEPLVVLQVALEGNISKDVIMDGIGRGVRAGGDMIPWLVAQQFQENRFGMLSGARVVRIACHPDYANVSATFSSSVVSLTELQMGYGSRALQALNSFYSGEYFNLDENVTSKEVEHADTVTIDSVCFRTFFSTLYHCSFIPLSDNKSPDGKSDGASTNSHGTTPPTFVGAKTREPGLLGRLLWPDTISSQVHCYRDSGHRRCSHYSNLRFWKRAGYVPLYVRQTTSELTGEHTCVMVRGLNSSTESELEWLAEFAKGALLGLWPEKPIYRAY